MAVNIKFDASHNAITPTFILATKSGNKLGTIPANDIVFKDCMNSYSEVNFKVYKTDNGVRYHLWDKLKDLKLLYCPEWDLWFEIYVEMDEANDLVKNVSAKSLGEAELSQINLYGVEINTENDIARSKYVPTVLYNTENTDGSLLHRIMQKVPHYRIAHVDESIAGIQRSFTFDGKSIYDAFQEIAEELDCIFILDVHSDENGKIDRAVSVYDLESYCLDCNKRNDFINKCPECGSTNFRKGYGEDTTIFVSTENLAEDISYSTDVDSVKNCFRLEAGDDLMTATVINCNPSRSAYLWHISDEQKEDMSDELKEALVYYDELYEEIQKYRVYLNISPDKTERERAASAEEYNLHYQTWLECENVYNKYKDYGMPRFLNNYIQGYSSLVSLYYNAIDAKMCLESEMMPDASLEDTSAEREAEKLSSRIYVCVPNFATCPYSTASNAVATVAQLAIDPRYQVKLIKNSVNAESKRDDEVWESWIEYAGTDHRYWTGEIKIMNRSDETDVTTKRFDDENVLIHTDEVEYIRYAIDRKLSQIKPKNIGISALFKLENSTFEAELHKYCLNSLTSFYDACNGCISVLTEQGIGEETHKYYEEMYVPYKNKLNIIQNEILIREHDIALLTDSEDGVIPWFERVIAAGKDELDFENFMGEDLWMELVAFRREDTYKNENYISDGLSNEKLCENAALFIEDAKKEIVRASTLQHSISATLKNLLVMKEFSPIVEHFSTGNWIRVKVDDCVYRLRLIDYEIKFDDLKTITISFSDVQSTPSGASDIKSILNQSVSMATSYNSVSKQAANGQKSNDQVSDWKSNGLSAEDMKMTNDFDSADSVWDKNGFIFRKYDPDSDSYDPVQMKIVNAVMSVTEDDWEHLKVMLGRFTYKKPNSDFVNSACGVNGEAVCGNLILGDGQSDKLKAYYINSKGAYINIIDFIESLNNLVSANTSKIAKLESQLNS